MNNDNQVRISIMENNLAKSYEKVQLGLMSLEEYEILRKDVRKAVREIKKRK